MCIIKNYKANGFVVYVSFYLIKKILSYVDQQHLNNNEWEKKNPG